MDWPVHECRLDRRARRAAAQCAAVGALGLIVAGLAGASVGSVLAIARGSTPAYARLEQAARTDDARSIVIGPDEGTTQQLLTEIAALPQVIEHREARIRGGTSAARAGRVRGRSFRVEPRARCCTPSSSRVVNPTRTRPTRSPSSTGPPVTSISMWTTSCRCGSSNVTSCSGSRPTNHSKGAGHASISVSPESRGLPGRSQSFAAIVAGPALLREHPDVFAAGATQLVRLRNGADDFDQFAEATQQLAHRCRSFPTPRLRNR